MNHSDVAEELANVLRENKILSEKLLESEEDRDAALAQSMKFSELLEKVVHEKNALHELYSLMKQKCDLSDAVISEFKTRLSSFMNNNGGEDRVHALMEQLLAKTRELESSNAVNIKLLKDNQNIREDVEGMLHVLNGLEKQLELHASREDEVEQMTKIAGEKWSSALALQEECAKREKFYVSDIQRLTAENRALHARIESLTQRRSGNSIANESDVDTNFATAGSVDFLTADGIVGTETSLDDSGSCLEDSQVSSIFIGYCGDAVAIQDAVRLLGFDSYTAEDVVKYILALAEADDKENGLQITQSTYQRGLAKLLAFRYISITTLQRSISDYIIDSFFSILDATESGACNAHEIGCGVLLFCEGGEAEKAEVAWDLLRHVPVASTDDEDSQSSDDADSREEDGEFIELYSVIQALSALYKAHSCLNPEVARTQPDYKSVADGHAITEIYNYWGRYKRGLGGKGGKTDRMSTKQHVGKTDFTRMFIVTLSKLQRHDYKQHAAPRAVLDDSDEDEEEDEDEEGYDSSDSGDDDDDDEEEDDDSEDHEMAAAVAAQLHDSMKVETFSQDGEDDEEDQDMYLNDELFPPSAVVLELRAARAILGLEHYAADDMLETLGLKCHAGWLSEARWVEWLWYVIDESSTSELDTAMARNLGNRIFAAFDTEGLGKVPFSLVAAGLSLFCGGSPLEDRLMVSFAVADDNSDGYISGAQFTAIVKSVLVLVSTCSKLATKKIVSVGVSLDVLATATASEGLVALSVTPDEEEISFEMISELSEDYIKLAAIF